MRSRSIAGVTLASILIIACASTATKSSTPTPRKNAPDVAATGTTAAVASGAVAGVDRVTGPFAHENLAVFVLCSDSRDDTDFLTLDEGLKDGSVVVSEKGQEEVNELEIENKSDRPLFLTTGDRVVGGKQDRIVGSSTVVPPHSGKRPMASFCVEHGRWHGQSANFHNSANFAVANEEVRAMALSKSQEGVWAKVAATKSLAQEQLKVSNSSSSLTEALDSAEVQKASDAYVQALAHVLDGKPDAVGVVFALNGKVVELDVFPGRPLVAKLYPRLLASYAFQAALHAQEPTCAVAAADVEKFAQVGRDGAKLEGGVVDYLDKIRSESDVGDRKAVMLLAK
jgi:hypothetical protein